MKVIPGKLYVIIILLFAINPAFSQLKLYQENGIVKVRSIEIFLEKNNFDYAIAAQSASPRMTDGRVISCLVKQGGSWFLFQISEPAVVSSVNALNAKPVVKQVNLSELQADSLLKVIRPEEGMKYSQEELYALPSTCNAVYKGKKVVFGGVSDAAKYHLVEKKGGDVISLSFYAADTYIRNCLPLNPDFKILTGMVNTFEKLTSLATSF